VFEKLATGIDGLDALLGGGIRYPSDTAAFVFISGQAGTGKSLLGLELLVRAFTSDDEGGRTFLFYSIEQSPSDLYKKLIFDFGNFFDAPREIVVVDKENPRKLCIETQSASGDTNRLVITQANPAANDDQGFDIDIEWIQAEIGNYGRASSVGMVCIDNVGLLLNDLDYFDKRAALIRTRSDLMLKGIHGIFIQEESAHGDSRFPTAEELSTDVLIHLNFEETDNFKARTIEVLKARHQYYYRGAHHFSIAGRGMIRGLFLGARGERGPGAHIYPSVPAQLSIARDEGGVDLPPRGEEAMHIGPPEISKAFAEGSSPTDLSSTAILAEPGTRYTSFALRFLAEGVTHGDPGLLVSTKEDPDAIGRIVHAVDSLAALRSESPSPGTERRLSRLFRLLYLHPEFLSEGKFVSDIMRMCAAGPDPSEEPSVRRMAFDNVFQLSRRFPLLAGQDFLIPALLDLLRFKKVTPLFVNLIASGTREHELGINPAMQLATFDNVLHLFLKEEEVHGKTTLRSYVRILKSVGNDFERTPFPITL